MVSLYSTIKMMHGPINISFRGNVVQKIKSHILCSVTFFFENRVIYEIMWKNTVELGRPQMTKWRMRIACWVP